MAKKVTSKNVELDGEEISEENTYDAGPGTVDYAAINNVNIHDVATIEGVRNPTGIRRQQREKREVFLATHVQLINDKIEAHNAEVDSFNKKLLDDLAKKFPARPVNELMRFPGFMPYVEPFRVPARLTGDDLRREYAKGLSRNRVIQRSQMRTADLSGALDRFADAEYDRVLLAAWFRAWDLVHLFGIIDPKVSGAGEGGISVNFGDEATGLNVDDLSKSLGMRKSF